MTLMQNHTSLVPAAMQPGTRLAQRLLAAKRAFSTRRVDLSRVSAVRRDLRQPSAGDVVLARVLALGQHARIEDVNGRRGALYVGDEIIVAYGNRYAPDQFEAYVPASLDDCHLVAGGGVAARMTARHARMKLPTSIQPLGLLCDAAGRTINLCDHGLPAPVAPPSLPLTIAVAGSSMNAGKTTAASAIVRGLIHAGFRVGAAKLTGTGSGGDIWSMRDAGAACVVDFTDAGHASTFGLDAPALEMIAMTLLGHLDAQKIDIAVIEIADGLLQRETAMLLERAAARGWFGAVAFAAGDAMSAAFGVDWLRARGLPVRCITGVLSMSPLAGAEAAAQTRLPVARLDQLSDGIAVTKLLLGAASIDRAAA